MPRSPLLQSAPSRNGPVHGQNGAVPPPLWSPKIHGTAVTPKPTPEMAKMIGFQENLSRFGDDRQAGDKDVAEEKRRHATNHAIRQKR